MFKGEVCLTARYKKALQQHAAIFQLTSLRERWLADGKTEGESH